MPVKTVCLLPMLVLLASACTSAVRMDRSDEEYLRLYDFGRNPERFTKVLEEGEDGVVLLLKKGEALPVQLTADLQFAKVVSGRNRLVFDRDVYVYMSRDSIMLSLDTRKWAPIYDNDALREVFGIGGGTLSIGFGVSKDQGPHGSVKLGTRLKE